MSVVGTIITWNSGLEEPQEIQCGIRNDYLHTYSDEVMIVVRKVQVTQIACSISYLLLLLTKDELPSSFE